MCLPSFQKINFYVGIEKHNCELSHHFTCHLDECASSQEIKAGSAIVEDALRCEVILSSLHRVFWSILFFSSDSMARLGTNMNEHASEVELYVILTTFRKLSAGI